MRIISSYLVTSSLSRSWFLQMLMTVSAASNNKCEYRFISLGLYSNEPHIVPIMTVSHHTNRYIAYFVSVRRKIHHCQFGVSTQYILLCTTHIIISSMLLDVSENSYFVSDIITLNSLCSLSEIIQYTTYVLEISVKPVRC